MGGDGHTLRERVEKAEEDLDAAKLEVQQLKAELLKEKRRQAKTLHPLKSKKRIA